MGWPMPLHPKVPQSLALLQSGIFFLFLVLAYLDCPGKKGKGSPYSVNERRVPELIAVLGSQPAGDVSHKPGSRLPLVTPQPLRGQLPILLLDEQAGWV